MAYVPVPKDLSQVKTKAIFNLTKRQLICFAAALVVGLPLFFLLKCSVGTSLAAFCNQPVNRQGQIPYGNCQPVNQNYAADHHQGQC